MGAKLKICFIVNPRSGTGTGQDMPALIGRQLDAAQTQHEIWFTEYAGHAEKLARQAAMAGFRVVVAVGGDGTVNEVGRGLLGTAVALGIVPKGSGNGLARHLRIPMDPAAAIRRLNAPTLQRMDVGRINGRPFFCTAGLGFDAHVSKCFAAAGTRGLSTYVKVALREYRRFRAVPIHLTFEDRTIDTDCYVLAFANASQYGNNAYIAPLADVRDGLLDLCLINSLPLVRAVRVGLALAVGNLPKTGAADFHRAHHIRVQADAPLGFHVDGDYVEDDRDFDIQLEPLALEVAV